MKTLVLGASLNPSRYSNLAIKRLVDHNIPVVAFGLKNGKVSGVEIDTELLPYADIETITLYMNPERQKAYYKYLLALEPKRIIFNPGTENPELMLLLDKNNIAYEVACTLTLLAIDEYTMN